MKIPDVKQWSLPNGLKVLFVADHKAPVVTVQVFYHAGGKDEPADKRGIAHMFEHMMFKGSTHVPPEAARALHRLGRRQRERLHRRRRHRLSRHRAAVGARLHAQARGRAHAQPQAHAEDHRLRARGGEGGAARCAWRTTRSRRRSTRCCTSPTRCIPTSRSPIGEKKMLDTVTVADCQKFYDIYYRPNNATLIVVGDTDEATVRSAGREVLRRRCEQGAASRAHDSVVGAAADASCARRR